MTLIYFLFEKNNHYYGQLPLFILLLQLIYILLRQVMEEGQKQPIQRLKICEELIQVLDNTSDQLKNLYSKIVIDLKFHPLSLYNNVLQIEEGQVKQVKEEFKEPKIVEITDYQACKTIWKCISRGIGKDIDCNQPLKYNFVLAQQLENIKKTIIGSEIPPKIQNKSLRQKLIKKGKQLTNKTQEIFNTYIKMQQKHQNDQERLKIPSNSIMKELERTILNLEKKYFRQTVVAIRPFQYNKQNQHYQLVELLLEQCYPPITLSTNMARHWLGQEQFERKLQLYHKYVRNYYWSDGVIIVCHRCLEPADQISDPVVCNNKRAKLAMQSCILTDPYLYESANLHLYQNMFPNLDQKTNIRRKQRAQLKQYIHPYLVYYCTQAKQPICGRYICQRCQVIQLEDSGSEVSCAYCEGTCSCIRCKYMDLITKMMSIYKYHGGDIQSLTGKFAFHLISSRSKVETQSLNSIMKRKQRSQEIDKYKQMFIKNGVFLEIQKKNSGKQQDKNKFVIPLSKIRLINFIEEKHEPYSLQILNRNQKQTLKFQRTRDKKQKLQQSKQKYCQRRHLIKEQISQSQECKDQQSIESEDSL